MIGDLRKFANEPVGAGITCNNQSTVRQVVQINVIQSDKAICTIISTSTLAYAIMTQNLPKLYPINIKDLPSFFLYIPPMY